MKYLVFSSAQDAGMRSLRAYDAVTSVQSSTKLLWSVQKCEEGYVLAIPATPIEAGVCITQEMYDNLLTDEEKQSLIDAITVPNMEF